MEATSLGQCRSVFPRGRPHGKQQIDLQTSCWGFWAVGCSAPSWCTVWFTTETTLLATFSAVTVIGHIIIIITINTVPSTFAASLGWAVLTERYWIVLPLFNNYAC